MHSLTDHSTAMSDKDKHDGMKFQTSHGGQAKGNVVTSPTLADPVCHPEDDGQRSGRGQTLKVLCFSRSVVRDRSGRDVEAGQTEKTAEGEGSEEELIGCGAKTNGESCGGGGDAKGDLVDLVSAFSEGMERGMAAY